MRIFLLLLALLSSSICYAQSEAVYQRSAEIEFETAYKQVYEALESVHFFVVFEAHISKSMARFEKLK